MSAFPTIRPRCRRGVALMLVIILMALTTVMAYALLAGQAVQVLTTSAQPAAAQADALAESGVQTAMYYLQHPKNVATLVPMSGSVPAYWAGQSNLTFTGLSGSANVTVAPSGTSGSSWTVSSTGSCTAANGQTLSKTVSATVFVNYTFQAPEAMAANTAVNLNSKMSITGNPNAIVTPLGVVVTGVEHITGLLSVLSIVGDTGASLASPPATGTVPDFTLLRSYSTYTYQGHAENASTIALLGNQAPVAGNTAGIFQKTSGSVSLVGPMTINGTIYIKNGSLNISGAVTVNPTPGFPAVIVNGALNFNGLLVNSLTTSGLVFLQNGVGTSNATSSLSITGGLMTNTAAIASGYNGSITVNYNASDVAVPDFTSTAAYMTPVSVKMTSYSP